VRRGDICIAGAHGINTGKPRPVIIVQDDRFDATASITVCPLTTNPVDAPLTRIDVEVTAAAGIEQPSKIMIDKITRCRRQTCATISGASPMQISSGSTAHSSYFSGLPNENDSATGP
jgi:mRNA interferase MazF